MEIAALMQGRDKSGGYCLEMNMGRVSRPKSPGDCDSASGSDRDLIII
jgi:hypothetical protein